MVASLDHRIHCTVIAYNNYLEILSYVFLFLMLVYDALRVVLRLFPYLYVKGSVAPSVTWADDAKYDQQMDMDQEELAREKYREERENEMFPDEVDTPETTPARLRFARYSGFVRIL